MNATTNLQNLRDAVSAAIRARDAIEDVFSEEWRLAHVAAKEACRAAKAETRRLAKTDRYGAWRTKDDQMMMALGYY